MGLPGLKYEVAQLIKNKYQVRKCLYENHVDDTEQAYEVHRDTNIEDMQWMDLLQIELKLKHLL